MQILLIGGCAGMLLIAMQKVIGVYQLFNAMAVLNAILAYLFLAFGSAPIKAAGSHRTTALALICLPLIISAASLINRDFTAMSLVSAVYYPVPMPKSGTLNLLSLVISVFIAPLVFYPLGKKLMELARGLEFGAAKALPAFFVGLAFGVSLVYVLGVFGPFFWLAVGLAGWSMLLLKPKQAVVALLLLVLPFIGYHYKHKLYFFTFGLTDYKYLDGGFGRDVKMDFLSFNDDGCLATVVDNIVMTYECADLKNIPSEIDYLLRVIVDPERLPPSVFFSGDNQDPAPYQRKSGLDVLDIGRSGGGYCRGLGLYSDANRNQAVEYEPAIASRLLQKFTKYTTGIYLRPGAKVLTGDYRTNLEELVQKGQQFDYIFLSGIGTRTYLLPRSYHFIEHFLLTEEGLNLILNRLLKPDGLVFMDWGSSDTEEADWFAGSFPKEGNTIAYWTTMSNYPISGSPMIYFFASKDLRKISSIQKRLDRLTGFRRITLHPEDERFHTTDNWPLLQPPVQKILFVFHLFLVLILLGLFFRMRRAVRDLQPLSNRTEFLYLLSGLGLGFAESLFAGFNPFVKAPFEIPAWMFLQMLFLFGLALGLQIGPLANRRVGAPLCLIGLALVGAGAFLLLRFRGTPADFVTAPLAGAGIALMLSALTKDLSGQNLAAFLPLFLFGQAGALALFELPMFLGGYRAVAGITFILALLFTIIYIRGRRLELDVPVRST